MQIKNQIKPKDNKGEPAEDSATKFKFGDSMHLEHIKKEYDLIISILEWQPINLHGFRKMKATMLLKNMILKSLKLIKKRG